MWCDSYSGGARPWKTTAGVSSPCDGLVEVISISILIISIIIKLIISSILVMITIMVVKITLKRMVLNCCIM